MHEPILPQRPTDELVEVASVDWLFEPDWPGSRLVASVAGDEVRLSDAAGAPVDEPGAARALSRAVRASSAQLDGVWTSHGMESGSAFVALDLLELDGELLLDVPFQERRRLLASVLEEGAHVRVGLLVKQPSARWVDGWRQSGFTHYLARDQNARYHPGARTADWLRIPLDPPGSPGFLRRVVGGARWTKPRIR